MSSQSVRIAVGVWSHVFDEAPFGSDVGDKGDDDLDVGGGKSSG
jgi:hypothetical protein